MSCNNNQTPDITFKRLSWHTETFVFRDVSQPKVTDPVSGKKDYPRINITGYDVFFTAKKQSDLSVDWDATAVIDKQVDVTDSVLWVAKLSLSQAETDIDTWYYTCAISYNNTNIAIWSQHVEQTSYLYLKVEQPVNQAF